jgi:hypothetical protein
VQATRDAVGARQRHGLVAVGDPEPVDRDLPTEEVQVNAIDGDASLGEALEAPHGGPADDLGQHRGRRGAQRDERGEPDQHGEPDDATAGHGRSLGPSIRPRRAPMLDCRP